MKLVILFVTGLLAWVAGAAESRPSPAAPLSYNEMLRRYDTNHDGRLDEAEIAAVQAKMKVAQPSFTNQVSGPLTPEEVVANASRKPVHIIPQEDVLKKFDLNKDGRLDAGELEAAKAALSERKAHVNNAPNAPSARPRFTPANPSPGQRKPLVH